MASIPRVCGGCDGRFGAFADDGGTVLMSSHLLAEVAQSVDDVVIIASGRLVRQAKLSELAPDGRELEDLFLSLTEAT